MRTLSALEARYADDHIPLALVLGALGALSAVRRLLPDGPGPPTPEPPTPEPPTSVSSDGGPAPVDPFALLLLGAIAAHDRLLGLLGPTLASGGADRALTAEPPQGLEGLLR